MEAKGLNDYRDIQIFPELVQLFDEMDKTRRYLQQIGFSKLTDEQYREKVEQITSRQTKK